MTAFPNYGLLLSELPQDNFKRLSPKEGFDFLIIRKEVPKTAQAPAASREAEKSRRFQILNNKKIMPIVLPKRPVSARELQ
ncbi:MAG: hypothetical protein M3Q07_09220 [Pseudobdellovibrionaceae bacterium]|nr:hypothetical protein [Pseudobdellovibrionaceae bacterium]